MMRRRRMRLARGVAALAVLATWPFASLSAQTGGMPEGSGPAGAEEARHFEVEPTPSPSSPNVLYIVLDDTGFADLGAYGSEISTPAMDSLARQGLRYNNFHTRAICSPTRAALLTGRNSHSVGMAVVTNMMSGYKHGQGRITKSAATIAEILQSKGYRTFALGKWHLSPENLTSSREQWPLGRGFDQYYGFLGGMTDQYYPDLTIDNTPVEFRRTPGYHLSEDLVDKAIGFVAAEKAVTPDRPFFLYLAFGASHAPHHVPASYIDKYVSRYAQGWDNIRAARFKRQKEMGIIPRDAELAPRNPDVKAWSELSDAERRVNTRFQATYAGFLEHTDEQIGRLIAFLKKSGQYDKTMIVLISDNGGSIEGHQSGTLNEHASLNLIPETATGMLPRLHEMGSEKTYQNYPSGWAQVSNTPFRFYKTTVWDGGLRAPLIVHYPSAIKNAGEVRSQFVDVVDITPTVLDVLQFKAPSEYKGVAQMPMAGASFRTTFADAGAPAPRDTQYFELLGQRAIWHNGWKAFSEHKPGTDFDADPWHLYNTNVDFSAVRDLAASNPEKLKEMQALWWTEARKYGVLPLFNAPLLGSFLVGPAANSAPKYKTARDARPEYVFYPEQAPLARADAPRLGVGSFSITAHVRLRSRDDAGVLIAAGERFGGYSLYLDDGYLVYEQSDFGDMSRLRANIPVNPAVTELKFIFRRTDDKGGQGSLFYDGKLVGSSRIARRATNSAGGSVSVGKDIGGPVSENYSTADGFPLPKGVLDRVIVRTGAAADAKEGEVARAVTASP